MIVYFFSVTESTFKPLPRSTGEFCPHIQFHLSTHPNIPSKRQFREDDLSNFYSLNGRLAMFGVWKGEVSFERVYVKLIMSNEITQDVNCFLF